MVLGTQEFGASWPKVKAALGTPRLAAGVSGGRLVENEGALHLEFDSLGPSEGFCISINKHTNMF